MSKDPGRIRAASASRAGTQKAQTPDQRRGHEKNHRCHEEALAFAEGCGGEGESSRKESDCQECSDEDCTGKGGEESGPKEDRRKENSHGR